MRVEKTLGGSFIRGLNGVQECRLEAFDVDTKMAPLSEGGREGRRHRKPLRAIVPEIDACSMRRRTCVLKALESALSLSFFFSFSRPFLLLDRALRRHRGKLDESGRRTPSGRDLSVSNGKIKITGGRPVV